MILPFSIDQFFGVFEKYNQSIYPMQIIIFALGFLAIISLHTRSRINDKFIGTFLGLLWIWNGIVYHIGFFSLINKPAFAFGGLFILQGLMLLINTFINKFTFRNTKQTKELVGEFFILFGLIIYPFIAYLMSGSFVRTISLGLPCPSTILTFGFFLFANKGFPKYLLIIPCLWSIVGLSAALNFGVYQDFMLIVAAITTVVILLRKNKIVVAN